jgi:hypothetical protein
MYEGGEFASTGPTGWMVFYRLNKPGPAVLDPLRQLGIQPSDGYPCATSLLPGGHLPGLLGLGDDIDALLDDWTERADDLGLATLSVQHVPVESPIVGALKKRDFVPFVSCAQAVSATPWVSFDEYLKTMSSSRRVTVRKERRVFEEAGYRIERVPLADADLDRMAQLHARWFQSRNGHDISIDFVREVLDRSVVHLADIAEVSVIIGPEGMAGFCLTYRYDGVLYPKMAGLDDRAAEHYGFFNGVFYATLLMAADPAINSIIWGPAIERAKVLRGADLNLRLTFIYRRAGVEQALLEACARRSRVLAVSLKRQLDGLAAASKVISAVGRVEQLIWQT